MGVVLKLEQNTKGRDFIVGDIHGAYELLDQALEDVGFDPEKDRLISVGDLIDRGPESPRSAEFLEEPWFFALKGNHEDLFLDICREDGSLDGLKAEFNILYNGMGWVTELTDEERCDLRDKFSKLPVAMEIETDRGTVGAVHADVPRNMTWQQFVEKLEEGDNKTIQTALWGRSRIKGKIDDGVEGIDRIFFGHSPQDDGAKRLGNCFYIDTGAVYGLVGGNEGCFLTISDITAKTEAIIAPDKNSKTGVVVDRPKRKNSLFRKYSK